MKKLPLILSTISIIAVIVLAVLSCPELSCNKAVAEGEAVETECKSGAIVYFNMDQVLRDYDMATDLRADVEKKAASINEELTRRGSKLEKEIKAFQEKINKGLLTQSVAANQGQKLQEQQQQFEQYTMQKQQEMAEEQQVMMNQIADAIDTFVKEFNAEKKYSMILATQGDILPAPVVTADPELDITAALVEGLNAAYAKSKSTK